MITFLRGSVFAVGQGYLDIDVNGVGYRTFVTEQWAECARTGEDIFVYTHHHVREDAVQLLGFETQEERDWFELLIGISGIGPKGAMQILSGTAYPQFAAAILDEDYTLLGKLPGVGKKTAQRLVVELKDKVSARWTSVPSQAARGNTGKQSAGRAGTVEGDVLEALISLGYAERHVSDIVQEAIEEFSEASVEDILRVCLQRLSNLR